MTNLVQLMAKYDPHYQMKLQQIQQSAYNEAYRANANMERERFKAGEEWQRTQYTNNQENQRMQYKTDAEWQQMQFKNEQENQRMHHKTDEEWKRTQYKTEQENQRTDKKLDREDQREEMRGKNALVVEEIRGQNALSLAGYEHQNKLVQMQADLENRMTVAGFESGILATQSLINEDNNRRANLLKQVDDRSQLRGEVSKMLMGAIIQEKLAQKQHKRDLEKMSHESELKRAEMYLSGLYGYLWQLMNSSREQEAKAEIDRLHEAWRASV